MRKGCRLTENFFPWWAFVFSKVSYSFSFTNHSHIKIEGNACNSVKILWRRVYWPKSSSIGWNLEIYRFQDYRQNWLKGTGYVPWPSYGSFNKECHDNWEDNDRGSKSVHWILAKYLLVCEVPLSVFKTFARLCHLWETPPPGVFNFNILKGYWNIWAWMARQPCSITIRKSRKITNRTTLLSSKKPFKKPRPNAHPCQVLPSPSTILMQN